MRVKKNHIGLCDNQQSSVCEVGNELDSYLLSYIQLVYYTVRTLISSLVGVSSTTPPNPDIVFTFQRVSPNYLLTDDRPRKT